MGTGQPLAIKFEGVFVAFSASLMGIQAQECVTVPSEKFWLRVTVHQLQFPPNTAQHRSFASSGLSPLPLNCHWTSRYKLDKHALKETREW